jgi:protein-disulfide isomerase
MLLSRRFHLELSVPSRLLLPAMDNPSSPSSSSFGTSVAIVIAGLIIGAAIYFSRQGAPDLARSSTLATTPTPAAGTNQVGERVEGVQVTVGADDPVLGKSDAPVTMVEFSDFQCPFCGQFYTSTFSQLKQQYIDTGKVRLVYKDFPLSQIHPRAEASAIAGQCALSQGKFWEYADQLFTHQSALADGDLIRYAEELGLNKEKFTTCFHDPKTKDRLTADAQEGIQVGITGTPGFLIDNIRLEGALPLEQFQQVIESELAAKK